MDFIYNYGEKQKFTDFEHGQKFKKLIRTLKAYTANNNVTDALIELSKFLGMAEETAKLETIDKKLMKAGYLTDELKVERFAIYQALMQEAKKLYNAQDYNKIYQSL